MPKGKNDNHAKSHKGNRKATSNEKRSVKSLKKDATRVGTMVDIMAATMVDTRVGVERGRSKVLSRNRLRQGT